MRVLRGDSVSEVWDEERSEDQRAGREPNVGYGEPPSAYGNTVSVEDVPDRDVAASDAPQDADPDGPLWASGRYSPDVDEDLDDTPSTYHR